MIRTRATFGLRQSQEGHWCACGAVQQEGQQPEGDTAVAVIDANTKVFIHLEGLVDPVKAAEKLRKQAASVMLRSSITLLIVLPSCHGLQDPITLTLTRRHFCTDS